MWDKTDFIRKKDKAGTNRKYFAFFCPDCNIKEYKRYRKQAICCNTCRPKFVGNKIKGRKDTDEVRKKKSISRLGYKMSNSTKEKLRQINTGKSPSQETRDKLSKAGKGRVMSEESRIKISAGHRGIDVKDFDGFVTPKNKRDRDLLFKNGISKQVCERANYCCNICDSKLTVVAHHLEAFATHPELRFDLDNMVCLCVPHHEQFHKKYGYKNNTKEQYTIFKGEYDE